MYGDRQLSGLHESIQEQLAKHPDAKVFRLEHEGSRWRGHAFNTVDGMVVKLRRIPTSIPTLSDLGFAIGHRKLFAHEQLQAGGLVFIAGMPGAGKSTTAAALLSSRVADFGAMAVTVEDPVEFPLHGAHGQGFCMQTEVQNQGDFASAVRQSMRGYPAGVPTALLIGETRDSETAALALQAAVDGRLVITTIHSGSIPDAISRIAALAEPVLSLATTTQLLAAGFKLGVHQKLDRLTGYTLQATTLARTEEIYGVLNSSVYKLSGLNTAIATQAKQLRAGQPIWT